MNENPWRKLLAEYESLPMDQQLTLSHQYHGTTVDTGVPCGCALGVLAHKHGIHLNDHTRPYAATQLLQEMGVTQDNRFLLWDVEEVNDTYRDSDNSQEACERRFNVVLAYVSARAERWEEDNRDA